MPPVLASDALLACFSDTLELKATKESAHSSGVASIAFSPDGKTIVSGSHDKTIKVWDAGQPFQLLPSCLSSLLTPVLLASQVLWSSRRAKRAPTAAPSAPSPSLPMVQRSSPDRLTRRSKCGTQVSRFSFRHDALLADTMPFWPQIPSL